MHNLQITNFKCFKNITIPINGLTLLAGANGNGKSTVIQTLLLLRHTIDHCVNWNEQHTSFEFNGLNVELNGPYLLALGKSSNLIPSNTHSESIEIDLSNEESIIGIELIINEDHLYVTPANKQVEINNDFAIALKEFYYLNAERLGPRISQPMRSLDFNHTGWQGEYLAQLIADTQINYTFKVEEARRNVTTPSPTLEQQINGWLDYLMPGVKIVSYKDENTLSAQIKVENHFTKGDSVLATNIGFGISYVLPIIVTGLIARKGSFMIVENPEAHLHPSAQSRIGRFLSAIAQAGVNVIVETHSDHVINGIQIAAIKKEINSDLVTINFFNQQAEEDQPGIENISINEKGELSNWPKGFFDQNQVDFAELLKMRRG